MNRLKQVLHLLAGKSNQHVLPKSILSATELDCFQGGKPAEVISETTYWWIEDEPVAPAFSSVTTQAQHHH
jgi:hypothetical protein